MNIRDYWSLPPSGQGSQDEIIKAVMRLNTYRGRDGMQYEHMFGCPGKHADAEACWYHVHLYRPGACSCSCHGGEW